MIQGTRNVLENCQTSILRHTGCVPGFTAAAATDFKETTNGPYVCSMFITFSVVHGKQSKDSIHDHWLPLFIRSVFSERCDMTQIKTVLKPAIVWSPLSVCLCHYGEFKKRNIMPLWVDWRASVPWLEVTGCRGVWIGSSHCRRSQ